VSRQTIGNSGALLEWVYRLDLPAQTWQRNIAREAFSRRGLGSGMLSYEFDASFHRGTVVLGTMAGVGDIQAFAAWSGSIHSRAVGDAYRAVVARGSHAGTYRETVVAEAPDESSCRPFEEALAATGFEDIWAACGVNPDATGIAFAIPFSGSQGMSRQLQQQWERVSIHVAAAHRLRKRIRCGTGCLDLADEAHGVFGPDGRELHLTENAVADQEALRRFIKAIDRERARELRCDGTEVLSVWTGLLKGRWSVLDQIDSDGKHFMLLFENEPEAAAPRALSRREAQVATYAAQGHANKTIGYELGIGIPTVATHLRNALAKLGLKSRTDLVWLFGRLAARPATGISTTHPD
jgi:DNA-binding CsgD family transcriptional regulator